MAYSQRRVVVTGLGALTPIGLTPEAFWDAMMRGESGAAPITYFDTEPFETKFACELKGFDPLDYLDRKMVRRTDVFSQYALIAAQQAVRDAGLDLERITDEQRNRIGVIFGTGIGGMKVFHEQTVVYEEQGPRRLSPFFIPMLIPDIAPGLISMEYGFRGPNYCVISACATGNNNIGDAYMLIQQGHADAMLAGGAEASITELCLGGFSAMKALSTRNDDPTRASRPFDRTRDGFVMGEGAGALFLEELEHARARGARIYAEMIGIGMSADAHHLTAPHPEGLGARLAMQRVLEDAGLKPEDVDYLNMHGTSTPLGDVAETKAIKQVFGDHAYRMSLSSTKSMTGHLLGAAGAVEAIAALLAVVHDAVPPTINFEHPDPECDLNYTFNEPVRRPVNVAMSNAFGFGGHNTTVAFKKYEE
ncbi:MAG: beta-ketoacyl-[acyl-carrier-protein] synthase II [Bacteroidetes bacterium]|nr:beta-ketoacyl-[acyl-carrier-protein] synthase II [Rhodothermaceae bacterium RA]RMH57660.1 MAG: beta-ketoacyl-[acyl-carrier-protein] synthase II [Bacteroidota bacterium]